MKLISCKCSGRHFCWVWYEKAYFQADYYLGDFAFQNVYTYAHGTFYSWGYFWRGVLCLEFYSINKFVLPGFKQSLSIVPCVHFWKILFPSWTLTMWLRTLIHFSSLSLGDCNPVNVVNYGLHKIRIGRCIISLRILPKTFANIFECHTPIQGFIARNFFVLAAFSSFLSPANQQQVKKHYTEAWAWIWITQ